ncbi:MAG TPA: hypothetical protein VLL98_00220 [Rickettsiales bacterium]|nr:hypothetical protein [Rickettsiales bacterium]
MKDKILEEDKELLLLLFSLSEIKNIDIKNIQSLDIGGRSFCFICKNTEKGNLFIKIDMDLEAFSFVNSFREREINLEKKKLIYIWKNFQNSISLLLKLFIKRLYQLLLAKLRYQLT